MKFFFVLKVFNIFSMQGFQICQISNLIKRLFKKSSGEVFLTSGEVFWKNHVWKSYETNSKFSVQNTSYVRRLPRSLPNRKYLTQLEFLSLCIKFLYTFSLFLTNGCNKNVIFLTLKLSIISLMSLKTPNFILISHLFVSCLSHQFILFLQVFHFMVFIFHSFKDKSINFGYVFLSVLYIRFEKL